MRSLTRTAHGVGALSAAMLLLVLTGCGGCSDPCSGVECPPGMECSDGECVPLEEEPGVFRCDEDIDCAAVQGRTRCDTERRLCVECTTASHCPRPEQQVCDPETRFCVSRPPCESHVDCVDLPANPWCDPGSGRCLGCLEDDHCGGFQQRCHLESGTCRFHACESDEDCADYEETPRCHEGSGVCAACASDEHCEEDEICRGGYCQLRGECRTHSECDVGRKCHPLSQQCVQCLSHADCRLGGRCVQQECRPAAFCEGDPTCGAPLKCDLTKALCVSCLVDGHCSPGQFCDNGGCVSGASCGPGVFCGPGYACEAAECAPFDCPADEYGAGPVPYEAAPARPGRLEDVSLCPNIWHWFVFDTRVGDGLLLELSHRNSSDHPEIVAWTGTGLGAMPVGRAEPTPDGQRMEVGFIAHPGPLWIGVRGVNEHLLATLDVEVVKGGLCEDDEFEPNHGPALAAALPPTSDGLTTVEAIACEGNDDWFYIPVPAGMRILAAAHAHGGSEGNAPLNLGLYGTGPAGAMQLLAGTGTFFAEVPARGFDDDVFVRIAGGDSDGVPYELEVLLRPPRPENDSCQGVVMLEEGEWLEGTTAGALAGGAGLCGGEGSPAVVYGISLEEARAATIVTEGYLDTILSIRSVCDDPASEVACSDVPGDVEILESVLPAGDWWVWVTNHEGREGDFRVRLETGDPPAPPLNDSCEHAATLDAGEGGGIETGDVSTASDLVAASCGRHGGDALYTLQLDSPVSLQADLLGSRGMSLSVRISCEHDASELSCVEAGSSGAARLDITYLPAGEHTLVVDGGGPGGGEYTMTWGLGSPVLPPLNDDCESAWPLDLHGGAVTVTGDTTSASDALDAACAVAGESGPDVVYWFFLSEPSSVEAALSAQEDGVLELRGPECERPSSALVCDDSWPATIFHPELPAGRYHLIVDGYRGESGPFELTVEAGPPLPPPGNDSCEDAVVLDVSSGTVDVWGHTFGATNQVDIGHECTGSATAGPDVVYAMDLEEGDSVTVVVTPEDGLDPALYVLDSCDATQCLAGADDWFFSEPETVTFQAGRSGRHFVVVDSWREDERGRFELSVRIE